jgi:hypothetical protein|tara:strand:- start:2583 stop:2780 length:198 start_codon:yes stop_codon:yes gene_type:complete
MNEIYIMLWALIAAGIYYSFDKHGKNQYNEGMSDAVCMHHTGTLEYQVILNEDGEEDLEIKINGG